MNNIDYIDYPMFKGLQRPLEFMGLQGRYIYWAAATAGGTLLGFMLLYAMLGFLVALIAAAVTLCVGTGFIILKQRKGLHSKKEDKGIFVFSSEARL